VTEGAIDTGGLLGRKNSGYFESEGLRRGAVVNTLVSINADALHRARVHFVSCKLECIDFLVSRTDLMPPPILML